MINSKCTSSGHCISGAEAAYMARLALAHGEMNMPTGQVAPQPALSTMNHTIRPIPPKAHGVAELRTTAIIRHAVSSTAEPAKARVNGHHHPLPVQSHLHHRNHNERRPPESPTSSTTQRLPGITTLQNMVASTSLPQPPSLFRYIDNHLLQGRHMHDKPPKNAFTCPVCNLRWDKVPIKTTYLPLSPCGHWVHYRCLIWRVTRNQADRANCPTCGVLLFEWEAIATLTLAARTGLLPLEHAFLQQNYFDRDANTNVISNTEAYEADCAVIEKIIRSCFNEEYVRIVARKEAENADELNPLARMRATEFGPLPASPHVQSERVAMVTSEPIFADNSPNLRHVFSDVLAELRRLGRPKGEWLMYHTDEGLLLWQMLVAIKLKRFAEENCGWLVATDGWKDFEEGRRNMMMKFQEKVHGEKTARS